LSKLVLENISLRQDSEDVIYDLSATFNSGINLLIGPTTAGKTTLMRIMAGLVKPSTGTMNLGGKDITKVSVQQRSVSFVYQQFINYPSLSVFQNIASPLLAQKKKQSKEEVAASSASEIEPIICPLSFPVVSSNVLLLLVLWPEKLTLFC
jgi:glycerol transport system ATP-binding protein